MTTSRPAIDLARDDVGHGVRGGGIESGSVDGLALVAGDEHLEESRRTNEATRMSGENPLRAALHTGSLQVYRGRCLSECIDSQTHVHYLERDRSLSAR